MKIIVASVPFNVGANCLWSAFARYGTVESVKVTKLNHSGRSNGYAIEMPDEKEANAAVNELNGGQVNGRTIIVSLAHNAHAFTMGSN